MLLWIFISTLIVVTLYMFFGILILVLTSFKHHDYYDDKDVTYSEGRPDWAPKDAFLIDCHTHTTASDGLLTPRQLILWHISNGYDGMVVSDHNHMQAYEETRKIAVEEFPNFLVIPGVEFTSLRVHLNIIGCKKFKTKPFILWTTKKTVKKAIDEAHKQGAVIQFNHRDWYFHKNYLPMEWYLKNNIDGWEIYNGFGFIDKEAPDFIKQNEDKRIMYSSAGTDVHDPAKHHRVYTEIISNDRSIEGVVTALKNANTRVYYDKNTEKVRIAPERGQLKKNPKKTKYIAKWKWLYWVGDALINGRRRKLFLFLVIIVLCLALLASFLL